MTGIDHRIDLDDSLARNFGFTSDKFDGWLWRKDREIIISFIVSLDPDTGNFSRLVRAIEAQGFTVAVPTPFARMQSIVNRWGFKPEIREDKKYGPCSVWVRPAAATE
jgi:hypothetical protein